jgi:hypothetical protein
MNLILLLAILALLVSARWLPNLTVPSFIQTRLGRAAALFKRRPSAGARLLEWAQAADLPAAAGLTEAETAGLADLRAWLAALPPAELEALARQCASFGARRRVRLGWLLEKPGAGEMRKTLSRLALYYGLAARERAGAGPAVALRTWQSAPRARANREFGKQLYTRLVDAGLIAIPADLLLAPEKERLAHQVSAILGLAESDRAALLAVVAQLTAGGLRPAGWR